MLVTTGIPNQMLLAVYLCACVAKTDFTEKTNQYDWSIEKQHASLGAVFSGPPEPEGRLGYQRRLCEWMDGEMQSTV